VSAKEVTASSKVTPCLRSFASALLRLHSKKTDILGRAYSGGPNAT
jgi:hypothetical protein